MPRPPGAPWWQDADHTEANWNPEDTDMRPSTVELTPEWADAIRAAYEAIRALMPNTTEEPT